MSDLKKTGDVFTDNSFSKEKDMLDLLQGQLGFKNISLDKVLVDPRAIKLIPELIAVRYNLIPISINSDKIQVVMLDPLNIFALDDVKLTSGYNVEPFQGELEDIKSGISRYYSGRQVTDAAEELSRENQIIEEDKTTGGKFENVKNAPVVKLVDSIIINAIKSRASDIHVEPFDKFVKIRYRIDGELSVVLKIAKQTLSAIVSRIKIMANLNIAEKRLPQDGRILTNIDDNEIDLRVSVMPTVYGEKVVIRILTKDAELIDKKKLGMVDKDLVKLNRIISKPNGIILVTGPTGSGKSTTLYAVLNEMNTDEKNIITVEDPVEFLLEGVNQINVNSKAGLSFAAALRSILRQDPDIIMIGEIRDNETAEIAVRSAITGHLVLSTIHTNDAPSAVVRLVDMGIEPYLIATSLVGVVAQRLVKKICPHCKAPYEADIYDKECLHEDPLKTLILYKGSGCPSCDNSGYRGRVGVYEIMEMTREHRRYIVKNASSDELRDLSVKSGMRTLEMSCKELVLQGMTTVDEIIKLSSFLD
ncbi:MAG TPA: GspE/PulE family protein [Clostridiaceae bacterium]